MDEYFVSWGALTFMNSAVANVDGRSPLKYFLGSVFFGPLVTLILAATREEKGGKLRQVDIWKGREAALPDRPTAA